MNLTPINGISTFTKLFPAKNAQKIISNVLKTPLKLVSIIPALLALLLGSCSKDQKEGPAPGKLPAVGVTVVDSRLQTVHNQIELLGTIQAVNRAEIAGKISGNITKLPVQLGSEVKKGDLLVEISAGEIEAKLQQTRTQHEQAKRNLDRERKLLQKNAATEESVKSLDEAFRIAEASYREALIFQEYTRITAPFSGRITKKPVNVGDLATPGRPLVSLEDESRLQVVSDIPEAMVLRVKQGSIASVMIPAADLNIPATVAEISPSADPASRTASVKLDIAASPNLRSGQFVRVFLSQLDTKTIVVPSASVSNVGQLERLFVVKDGVAKLRLVKSGASFGSDREILSGLTAGEKVVSKSQEPLRDGQPVSLQ